MFCVFRKRDIAQFFSAGDGTELVIVQDGEYCVIRDMSSGMCSQESFYLPNCVSAKLSPFAERQKTRRKKKRGERSIRQLSKMWLEFQEAALVT